MNDYIYGGELGGPFSKWLSDELSCLEMPLVDIAQDLMVSCRSIQRHLSGKSRPTFPMVIAYCWYVRTDKDPMRIWKLVEEQWGECDE